MEEERLMSANDPMGPDEERLVRALESGASGEAQLRRERPDLAHRLTELRELERALTDVGREDAALRSIAARDVTLEDRESAERFVRGRLSPARTRPWRPWMLLAAAALVLLVSGIAIWSSTRPTTAPGRVMLGSSGMTIRSDSEGDTVTWEPAGIRYRVSVERVVPAADGTTLLDERKQSQTRWSPTDEQRATWPARVRVHVHVLDDSGVDTGSYASLELSLSSPSSH